MKITWWLIILALFWTGSVPAADQQLRVAMLLWRGETEAEAGFKDGLQELGYHTSYEIHDAAQDLTRLGSMLHAINNNLVSYDYVYTFGTTVSRRAQVVLGTRIPQIFNIVTDPVAAGIVTSLDSPGITISGGSDMIGIAQQLDEVRRFLTFTKLGFFFNPREKNSLIIRDELYRYAKENGFKVIDFRSPPVDHLLEQNLEALSEKPGIADAVYFAPDSYLSSEAALIGNQLRKSGIISISQIRTLIEHGVLIGVAGNYYNLGKRVAAIVDRHQKGMPFEKIPVERFKTFKLLINRTTADLMGLKLDKSLSADAELVD